MREFDPLLEWLGIPPNNRPVDYYSLLGLKRFESDTSLIAQSAQARRLIVQRYLQSEHAAQAQELLALLAQAEACLLQPARKAAYDDKLRRMAADTCVESRAGRPVRESSSSTMSKKPVVQSGVSADTSKQTVAHTADEYGLASPPPANNLLSSPVLTGEAGAGPATSGNEKVVQPKLSRVYRFFAKVGEQEEIIKLIFLVLTAIGGILLMAFFIFRLVTSVHHPPANQGEIAARVPSQNAIPPDKPPEAEQLRLPATCPISSARSNSTTISAGGPHQARKGDQAPPAILDPVPGNTNQSGAGRPGMGVVRPTRVGGRPGALLEDRRPEPADEPKEDTPDPANTTNNFQPPQRTIRVSLPSAQILGLQGAEILLRAAGVGTKSRLDAVAERVRFAEEMLLLYQAFLKMEGIPEEEKEKARQHLPVWEKRASEKMVRLGELWLTAEEWMRRKEEARAAVRKALLFLGGNDRTVINELEKASRLDPELVSADFLLGLLYALLGPKFGDARQCFRRCVQRKPDDLSAWNNLALTEYRSRAYASACAAFRKAIELGGAWEVTYNLKNILLADQTGVLPLPPANRRALADLYTKASERSPDRGSLQGQKPKGFFFLPIAAKDLAAEGLIDPPPPPQRPAALTAVPTCCVQGFGTGFVIAPGYVVTNRHVVEAGDLFAIILAGTTQIVDLATVAVVEEDESFDLAILECPNWKGEPMPLAKEGEVEVGTKVGLLGFPEPSLLGPDLKISEGTIFAVPSENRPLFPSLYLVDIRSHPGNSGGPLVDARGQIVAVHTGRDKVLRMSCGIAVPANKVVELMKKISPDFSPGEASPSEKQWVDIVEEAKQSVVLIQILAAPFTLNVSPRQRPIPAPQNSGAGLYDSWCLRCNGEGIVDCPNRWCGNGAISTTRERILAVDPISGRPTVVREPTTVPCRTCGGRGRVECPVCGGSRHAR